MFPQSFLTIGKFLTSDMSNSASTILWLVLELDLSQNLNAFERSAALLAATGTWIIRSLFNVRVEGLAAGIVAETQHWFHFNRGLGGVDLI